MSNYKYLNKVNFPSDIKNLSIDIVDEGVAKKVVIEGMLDGKLRDIKGRDRAQPVTFQNIFNQIHSPTQVIAQGDTRYDDGEIAIFTEGTHALHSNFDWIVKGA